MALDSPSPSPGSTSGFPELRGVSATSATDAWAVGLISAGSGVTTLAEHWAVGVTTFPTSGVGTFIERWNGTAWKEVASP